MIPPDPAFLGEPGLFAFLAAKSRSDYTSPGCRCEPSEHITHAADPHRRVISRDKNS